jgi:hypothetical protein
MRYAFGANMAFEIAADGKGFATDEPLECLKERLFLAAFPRARRWRS